MIEAFPYNDRKVCEVSTMTLAQLKEYAKFYGLPVSGTKAQLCDRIISYIAPTEISNDEFKRRLAKAPHPPLAPASAPAPTPAPASTSAPAPDIRVPLGFQGDPSKLARASASPLHPLLPPHYPEHYSDKALATLLAKAPLVLPPHYSEDYSEEAFAALMAKAPPPPTTPIPPIWMEHKLQQYFLQNTIKSQSVLIEIVTEIISKLPRDSIYVAVKHNLADVLTRSFGIREINYVVAAIIAYAVPLECSKALGLMRLMTLRAARK